ncbi:PilN domain-containing protein [Gynuella sunshinyii]|uniref:Tfp pilus assembly protein PilN n=1 Tax=Gynuella sunshinyii YC6258 TaxID=1445510 RepID=A0A0C5VEV0_9GAMM|nr:PilN domain-containing protein [Gynuella sunshinyii]AJQ93097.1 tfp pilus assembly protein PilN [Gynuella sunshinyii YC6258]
MANINLRPWRAELRKERQQQFVLVLLFVCVAAVAAVYSWNKYVDELISVQKNRNNFLTEQINIQKKKIDEIKTLQEERTKLVERMNVIQALQGDRPVIVRVFDELVRTLPDGVYYEEVSKKGAIISLNGVADKPSSISDLLRNLDASQWFDNAFLKDIKAVKDASGEQTGNSFNIVVQQSSPRKATETEGQ